MAFIPSILICAIQPLLPHGHSATAMLDGTGVDSIEYFEEAIRSLVGPLLYAAGSPNAQTSDVPTVAYE